MQEIVEQVWRLQREWSQRANQLKTAYSRWQVVSLALAISGAVLGTLSAQLASWGFGGIAPLLAGAGAASLALIAVIGQWATTPERLQGWVRARSVSEELKALTFTYLAGCSDPTEEDSREKLLWNRAMELVEAAADLAGEAAVPDEKPVPAVHDVASYLSVRVDSERPKGQIQYYRDSAAKSSAVVRTSRNVRFALASVGAIVAAVGALGQIPLITTWIAVATTVVAALAAHVGAGRHEFLSISYLSTAARLRRLQGEWIAEPDGDPCRLVSRCETAISSQNEGWMVEFMKMPDKQRS